MSVRRIRLAIVTAAASVGALAAFVPGAAVGNGFVPTADVTGPIPVTKTSYPFLATDIDLKKYGYVEREYFIEGQAYRYSTSGGVDQTGTRITTGGPNSDGAWPFKTRIIVRRPAKDADFNGVVVAEWMNVTAFHDLEANWFGDPYYLLKNGYAFVGVSAQAAGVRRLVSDEMPYKLPGKEKLPPFNPVRYAGLTVDANGQVPNDDLSYDIYSAAVNAVRGVAEGPDPLGGLRAPEMVIASGESQSCGRLAVHHNKIEPLHGVIDAWYLSVCSSTLRTDRPAEKAIRVLTETETASPKTEPDSDSYRHWEVAGASHLPRSAFDNWNGVVSRDREPQVIQCTKFPLSVIQWAYTQNRAIAGLVEWVDDGVAPPIAPRGQYNGSNQLVRDEFGNALGGIRYPSMEVPVAEYLGTNSPLNQESLLNNFCGLLGSTTYFDLETVGGLYTDHRAYVTQIAAEASRLQGEGFVLDQDVPRLIADARAFPRLRPEAPAPRTGWSNGSVPFALLGTTAPSTKFEFQRRPSTGGDPAWQNVKSKGVGLQPTIKDEPQGSWQYRVRSRTTIPATNISEPETVVTPWSEPSTAFSQVDRTAPKVSVKCPKQARSGRKVTCTVKVSDSLSGVKGSATRKVQRTAGSSGVLKVEVTGSDLAGNKSVKVARVRVS